MARVGFPLTRSPCRKAFSYSLHDCMVRKALSSLYVCDISFFNSLVLLHEASVPQDQQGEVALTANLTDPSYKFELASAFPFNGLPRATLRFPKGELSVEEKENEEAQKVLSWSGIFKSQILNGVCTALYKENDLNLRYCYKDGEMSFIPSICLPSNALSFAFKRRFSPSDKLSYWYHLDSDDWSAVYKRGCVWLGVISLGDRNKF
ncbi:hypothetical protein J5N97_012525 [Dioscorea zingiberensis]|uniref:Uncharacterized protein n=1 Tax=Dioscorea zingiberensis TaxID=325984 RepID=A0A9D5CPF8_9LILI|nr:hypothetical protein J5N97_012525 [Dioscorea zingiberensis]